MRNNKIVVFIIVLVFFLVISFLGRSFAWFNYSNELPISLGSANTNINVTGTKNLTLTNLVSEKVYKARNETNNYIDFTVNASNMYHDTTMYYYVKLNYGDSVSGKERIEDDKLVFDISKEVNGESVYIIDSERLPIANSVILFKETVNPQETKNTTYRFRVWVKSETPSWLGEKYASFVVEVYSVYFEPEITAFISEYDEELTINKIIKDANVDNINSLYVNNSTPGIDFSNPSSDTNGKGLYIMASTVNDENPIYYYRGNIDNNNAIFANYCWKIIRTTETGGLKLLYNGVQEGRKCEGTNYYIASDRFQLNNGDNAYMGYMYGEIGATNYDAAHTNSQNSNMKDIIEAWYHDNMTDYTPFLEDTVYCNDRSLSPESAGLGYGSVATNYMGRYRLNVNKTPSLACTNANDRFTVGSTGNGKLTYPVGLITADELAYAGGVWDTESDYFLNTGSPWWSMTPSRMNNVYPSIFVVLENGGLWAHSGNIDGIRPMISVDINSLSIEGSGTSDDPYYIYEFGYSVV